MFCPAFVGRRAIPTASRASAGARAAWNKWKGPAAGGKAAVYAAKGPCGSARGATVRIKGERPMRAPPTAPTRGSPVRKPAAEVRRRSPPNENDLVVRSALCPVDGSLPHVDIEFHERASRPSARTLAAPRATSSTAYRRPTLLNSTPNAYEVVRRMPLLPTRRRHDHSAPKGAAAPQDC